MNNELENKLFKRFPKIFPNGRNVNTKKSLMCFGMECGDGWFDLIWKLCEDLEKIGDDIVVAQIKSKFAGLRYYTNSIPMKYADTAYKRIAEAEKDSYEICEKCGKPGKLRDDSHWLVTLCDKHNDERVHEAELARVRWEERKKKEPKTHE